MQSTSRIYVAGHTGLVGRSLCALLRAQGFTQLLTPPHADLELTDPRAVEKFFAHEQPEYVFLLAGKVGGIIANSTYPAEFIDQNLMIAANVLRASHAHAVRRVLFFGSACIYPRETPSPIRESYLLSAPLERTNQAYAVAKIAAVALGQAYNQQYGTQFFGFMPNNLYGPGDNFHPQDCHVIPGLIRKFHEAKIAQAPRVTLLGSGTPQREFVFVDDLSRAALCVMQLSDDAFRAEIARERFPIMNVGSGDELPIASLAALIREVVGFPGDITWDTTKPDGVARRIVDSSRLRALGWQPTVDMRTGLQTTYTWFREHIAGHP